MSKFAEYFQQYKSEAFRFESLPVYKVQGEWEDYKSFLRTGIININPDFQVYKNNCEAKLEKGIRHIRLRMVHNPITKYEIFETYLGYIPLAKIGAEINIVSEIKLKSLLNGIPPDFWLFDKSFLVVMNYNSEGKYIGHENIEDRVKIKKFVDIRNILISNSNSISVLLDQIKS